MDTNENEIECQTKLILEEGKRLYKSEMASWYATDIYIPQSKEKPGGYLSYPNENNEICIFFSEEDRPKVISTFSFVSTFDVQSVDHSVREFTQHETDLFTIRSIALKCINIDPFFKKYANTNLNVIPLILNGAKKVYVLTAPTERGVLIFGNDYLLTFDNENRLVNKKQIHQNIIVHDFRQAGEEIPEGARIVAAQHTHLPQTGDLITATDVCTLMLYEKFSNLEWYYVGSENNISVWNCLTDELTIRHEGLKNKR